MSGIFSVINHCYPKLLNSSYPVSIAFKSITTFHKYFLSKQSDLTQNNALANLEDDRLDNLLLHFSNLQSSTPQQCSHIRKIIKKALCHHSNNLSNNAEQKFPAIVKSALKVNLLFKVKNVQLSDFETRANFLMSLSILS